MLTELQVVDFSIKKIVIDNFMTKLSIYINTNIH